MQLNVAESKAYEGPSKVLKSNVSNVGPSSESFSLEGPMLETLDFTIRIGSTPTF